MAMQDQTKARLLEAAGEEFAEKWFESARIRTICQQAGANLAAVNYHFGDKERLYVEAVLEAHRCGMEPLPDTAFLDGTPAELLRRYIHHFLGNVLALDCQPRWHHALMLRELIHPTPASETLVREAIRPRFERLVGILRRICPEAEDRRIHALAFSVIGQCLHYKIARPISERLIGSAEYGSLDLEFLTEHITGLCLAALGQISPFNEAGEPSTGDAVPLLRGNER
jgi:AcrR family transcriptional regulator